MTTEDKLLHPTDYFNVAEERGVTTLVIGAPHHAAEGVERLPCPSHTDADENTGHLTRYIAERLGVGSVVTVNATVDPNKTESSEYVAVIRQWQSRILSEIHGHGGRKANADIAPVATPYSSTRGRVKIPHR